MSRPPTRIIPLEPAALDWRDKVPVSRRYGDVYFSQGGGLAETQYVFLRHNDLPERWRAHPKRSFVIAETGFGTGLNFLAAARAWLESTDPAARLHYVSVEKHPLAPRDLRRALDAWPELSAPAAGLLEHYPPPVRGTHRRALYEGRVQLTLHFMDAAEWLDELELKADAWFLDGFAPARNPELWSERILTRIGALTAPGGSFATFTAAGEVRRRLQAAGFEVSKAAGYGGKREMLHGRMTRQTTTAATGEPWFRHRAFTPDRRSAVVVGAGLAGAFTAQTLARRGWEVAVLERAELPAQGASGNAAAVIYGKFSTHDAIEYRFYQHAYLYAADHYPALRLDAGSISTCGMLQLPGAAAERAQQAELAAVWPPEIMRLPDANEAGELAGMPLDSGGLWFPHSGWIAPARVCEQLLRQPGVELKTGCAVASLDYADGGWRLLDPSGRVLAVAPVVILANAGGAGAFPQTEYLPLSRVRGQVSYIPLTRASARLRTVLSFDGYITPAMGGLHSLGATFDRNSAEECLLEADHLRNLRNLEQAAPALYGALAVTDVAALPGRVAFRSYAGELPVVGPAPQADFYLREYAGLAKGQLRKSYPEAACHPGLYLNLAHGARGVTSTPLAAEIIAAYLEGEPQPVPESLRRALHPGRFLIRRLRKNKRPTTESTEGI